ncbi:Carboxypeptidase A4 [Physocladia obscura]|uniref:Carboxypeptidase A4 n=1 Tax=Physocladia obscura TaxID=109957 RepID=A0AAD5XCP2_9FUNG|nr:Carboxypeptidase A4 [Physocladia obscura]
MKISNLVAALFAIVAPLVAPEDLRYKNHQVVKFNVTSDEQVATLKGANFDIWTHSGIHQGIIEARVPAGTNLDSLNIPYMILIKDLQQIVDKERAQMEENSIPLHQALLSGVAVDLSASTIFSDWQSYETLCAFIASLPGVTPYGSIGSTYLGQDTLAYKFGSGPQSIVYHGGIHAREWISPATVAYLTNEIVSNTTLTNAFTFYVLPVANPDGYNYTRAADGDRYQRKNMQPNPGSTCIGTDPNRNFNNHWSDPGASNDVCADDYYGPAAFSTPEALNIANFVQNLGNVISYVDFHSYSELFMFPNGYTCSGQVADYATLEKGSQLAVDAIQAVNGEVFANGPICTTIYQASGSSIDYTYNNLGVKYSYAIELRPNANAASGDSGFNPDVSAIPLSGAEITAGMNAVWGYIASLQNSGTITTTKASTSATKGTTTTTTTTTKGTTTITTTTKGTTTTTTTTKKTTTSVSCSHSECTSGVALKTTCSACAKAVCANDSYCCLTAWDSQCVSEVDTYCTTVNC